MNSTRAIAISRLLEISPSQRDARKRLIAALRAEMPPRFEWNFELVYEEENCGAFGCGIGLAKRIGLIDYAGLANCAEALGLAFDDAKQIFMPTDYWNEEKGERVTNDYEVPWIDVTPQMVADALEAL